jgi:hypothetical protein
LLVVLIEETIDGGFEIGDGSETPRFSRRFVSVAKNPSTALSQDAEVGVKWKVCKSRSNNPSLKRPIGSAAPESNCGI